MSIFFITVPLISLIAISILSSIRRISALTFCWLLLLSALQILSALFFPGNLLANNAFSLQADNLSRVLLLSIGIVIMVTVLAAEALIREQDRKFYFFNLIMVILAGMNGIVLSQDIFSLYVFLEVSSVASFIIISLKKERDGLEGAFKYIIFSSIASVMLLSSIALTLITTGETSFAGIAHALQSSPSSSLVMLALGVYLSAFFIKSGLIPFHGWLPDAYSASTSSASILLAGIVTKTVGVYPLIRICYSVFGFDTPAKNILLLVGALSIVVGALAAIGQTDFKRLLAYSSISQVGYIIVGLGCGTALGLAGAIFHLFNHSIFKTLLFLNAAAVKKETNLRDINQMGGLAAKMPVTGVTSALAALSTAGIPPLSGFWSKLIIIIALWKCSQYIYAVIAVLASVITLAYMLTLQRKVFFGKLRAGLETVRESGFLLSLPAVILALIVIGVGIFFPLLMNSFLVPIGSLL